MKRKLPDWAERKAKIEHESINGRIQRWREKGSNMSPGQVGFFKAVAQRDYLWYHAPDLGKHLKFPSAMEPGQRDAKGAAIRKLRGGLADLAMLRDCTAPKASELGFKTWMTSSDVRKALNLDDLCDIVGYSIDLFGREYADAILERLNDFYGREGEEIVVQRAIRHREFGVRG